MVAPERDTPGTSASDCARPMLDAVGRAQRVEVALLPPDAVGDVEHQAEDDERRADEAQVAGAGLDLVGEGHAEDDDRDGRRR